MGSLHPDVEERRYVIAETMDLGKCLFSSILRGYWPGLGALLCGGIIRALSLLVIKLSSSLKIRHRSPHFCKEGAGLGLGLGEQSNLLLMWSQAL